MTPSRDKVAEALRISLKEAERLRQQNRRLGNALREPIAIVGMSCRLPGGVRSTEDLWQLVHSGEDGISEFPDDRGWDNDRLYDPDLDKPGTSRAREGGFLADAGDFDAGFFEISPREALLTDPQERLWLEACWEALEDAGIVPTRLRGGPTGVFAGVMYHEYGDAPGMTTSVVSGRLAYALGLEGPAVSVDTACSSSLVAVHLAAHALRQGECSLALAGGVTVLATPQVFVESSRQGSLAPGGRSRSFADAAEGVALGEGVGALVLERLSDAQRNGHPVLAVIRGSAVNQDGASNGLTAPNGPSQERVIRQALANARLEPRDVDVVEAHGTGTTLGDPIEAGALLATYGQDREEPLKLGSIKSNVGHTQAAAGVAGVVKMVMAMREGVLPRTLHVDAPSSKVDWEAGRVELLTEEVPWTPNGRPRRAGVSSFGISGTNAHLILEEAPQPQAASLEDVPPSRAVYGDVSDGTSLIPLPLSAKSEPALREQAARLARHLRENPELQPLDVAHSLATTRSSFERRGVALGENREELLDALSVLAEGGDGPRVARGTARQERRPVFLFPGQGSQWNGMAVELLDSSPVFAAHMKKCEEALSPHIDWSVRGVLRGHADAPSMERIEVVQPTLFAVSVSLAELWRSCGVHPAAVAGHSQGEIAAACVAGGLSLEDAAMLAAVRSRIISKLAGQGAMVSVFLSPDQVESRLERWEGRVEVAAHNGPSSTILAADRAAAAELLALCAEEGVRAREIPATIPSHSAYVEPLREDVLEALASLSPRAGDIPFHSTVISGLLDTAELDAAYWYRNLRETVRFEQVTRGFLEQGQRAFLEMSPHPVLAFSVQETIDAVAEAEGAAVIPSLRREEGGTERFALSFAEAHASGAMVDWEVFFRGSGARSVRLPTYAFQRRRYWLGPTANADARSIGQGDPGHPLLAAAIEEPEGEGVTLTGRLSLERHPWLKDHAVAGSVLLPGTAFCELALTAGREAGAETLRELTLQAPLLLPEQDAIQLQVRVEAPGEGGERSLSIHSRPESDEDEAEWTCNATGTLGTDALPTPEPLDVWPPKGAEPLDVSGLYERLADAGFEYGAAFEGLTAAWRQGEELFAEVSLAEAQAPEAERYGIHPALLDSALQAIGLRTAPGQELALPLAWSGVALHASCGSALRVRISPSPQGQEFALFAPTGAAVASVESIAFRPVDLAQQGTAGRHRSLHRVEWHDPAPQSPSGSAPSSVALLGEVGIEDLEGQRHADIAALLEALEGGAVAPAVTIADFRHVGPAQNLPEAAHATSAALLELVQRWIAAEPLLESCLVILTGASPAGDGERARLETAPLAGLLRSAHSEHPGRFALIDTDGAAASDDVLPAALAIVAEEPQIALREGAIRVPRLLRVPGLADSAAESFDPERTVLVTGGTSGLGALLARHLATQHGVRHLLLASRRGEAADRAAELKEEIEGLGCEVTIAACDVADREQLSALLGSMPADHPLGAVIHSAAVLDDGVLQSLDADRLERAMRPKVDAAWHLHELTAETELSHFVLLSSASALIGNSGQGNYAAANAFLDALAHHRRAAGLSGTSLALGAWAEESEMVGERGAAVRARFGRIGLRPMPSEQLLDLFDSCLSRPEPLLAPVAFEHAALRSLSAEGTLPPIMRAAVPVRARRETPTGSLASRLSAVPAAEREAVVLELVRGHVAAVLGHASAQEVEPDRAFQELGLASIGAVELRNRLAADTGIRLPTTVVFDHPNARTLAAHLHERALGASHSTAVVAQRMVSEEQIAIVGMACRYPGGADSPEKLWRLVASGGDAISPFPTDRGWALDGLFHADPDNPGTTSVREAGFVEGVTDFDPGFFGISPREALAIDPQQRLLLEASWEALERGGMDPTSLRGSDTGVFAGATFGDYGMLAGEPGSGGGVLVGSSASVVSGRISYTLGLEGPAVTVDTACSSSLVGLHLACQALRQDECSLALAGGVMVIATPWGFVDLDRQRAMSPDGRCKAFADAADGTGFAEGAGVVVLERLSDARRLGHPVLATVRASAVNQDGASNGLTAPSGPSQERVIRQALANGGLEPHDVDVVEAHGTGTVLGDPIEAEALIATYGQNRERPLALGSIKSNFGHSAAAAGVAGVIKMVMAIREGTLPKTLHVDRPSTKIEWAGGNVELLTDSKPWPADGRPRRAGVSSFGMSGTNAHLILEEAVDSPPADRGDFHENGDEPDATAPLPGRIPLVLSAKNHTALQEAAARLRSRLVEEEPGIDLADAAWALFATRPAFAHRAVAVSSDRERLLAGLAALAAGRDSSVLHSGVAGSLQRPAFVFPGYGSQWQGMAVELMESSPFFADKLRECGEALGEHLDWSLERVLRGEDGAPALDRLDVGPPALFAVTVSLAALWRACGVEPSAVAGHSQGEIVAAHVAGGLSLEDAARVSALRSKLLLGLVGKGAMASFALPVEQLEFRLQRCEGLVEIAAINGPSATVATGDPNALDELLAECVAEGIRAKKVPGAVAAGHSRHVDSIRDELLEALAPIEPRSSRIPFHSTVTGKVLDTAELDAEYWYRNARRTVRLEPVVRSLLERGCRALVEVSPHPVLAVPLRETVEAAVDHKGAAVLSTLRRDGAGPGDFAHSVAAAHVAGVEVDWTAFVGGAARRYVSLPTYPFQRKRFWPESRPASGDVSGAGLRASPHPLLGAVIESPDDGAVQLTGRVSLHTHRWLADHAVLGVASLPGAALLDLVLVAAAEVGARAVEELTLQNPLTLPDSGAVRLSITVGAPDDEGRRSVAVHSRLQAAEEEEDEWSCNALGTLSAEAPESDGIGQAQVLDWLPKGAEALDPEQIRDRLADAGFDLGPSFQGLREAWRKDDETFVEVGLAEEEGDQATLFHLHPSLLDAATHPPFGSIDTDTDGEGAGEVTRPFTWRGVTLHRRGASTLRARIFPADEAGGFSLIAVDESGAPVLSVDSLVRRPLDAGELREARRRRSLYRLDWRALSPKDTGEAVGGLALLGDGELPVLAWDRYPDVNAVLEAAGSGGAPRTVVVDWRRTEGDLPAASGAYACRALELFQTWISELSLQESRLVVLTRGALVASDEEDPDLIAAPVTGLLASASAEHPGRFALIDVDGTEESWSVLSAALARAAVEPRMAIRGGRLLAPRLVRVRGDDAIDARSIDPETTVLITGGTSGLGALVARHLANRHHVRHLLLASRRGEAADGAQELRKELEGMGCEVTIAACDVADPDQLAAMLDSIPAAHPLGALIHSAAALDNGVLGSLNAARLEAVLRPKVDAAWHLHEATKDLDLSQFVLFSSVAGILGHVAQANYAAGNVFLDALAAHRRTHGLTATSLAWGGWLLESNLFGELSDAGRVHVERQGVGAMTPDEGLEHFDRARAIGAPLLAPVRLDRAALRRRAEAGSLPPVLRGLVDVPVDGEPRRGSLKKILAEVPEADQEPAVVRLIRSHLAEVLGHASAEDVDPESAFQEMGVDSLVMVEFGNALAAATGVPVPILALVDNPTPVALASYLLARSKRADGPPPEMGPGVSPERATFVSMLTRARERGELRDFLELVATASRFRESFDEAAPADDLVRVMRLVEGQASTSLLLTPSVGAMSGPHEYVRLAQQFAGERSVFVLSNPGFARGEPLPASVEAAAELHARALTGSDVGERFAVAGHSSGGWLAHALAERLEDEGAPPAMVILLDTYLPQDERLTQVLPVVLAGVHEAAQAGDGVDDVRLTAMGGYKRIFDSWRPRRLAAATVVVRAGQPAWEWANEDSSWRASWSHPHSLREVVGNHVTMMEEEVESTARVLTAVLDGDEDHAVVSREEHTKRMR